MARINTRAIEKLLEAHRVLKKESRRFCTQGGMAFTEELIRLIESGKNGIVVLGEEEFPFKQQDIRVSRTHVNFGKMEIVLGTIQPGNDDEAGYETVLYHEGTGSNDDIGETVKVALKVA
jgi:hypothetical protein